VIESRAVVDESVLLPAARVATGAAAVFTVVLEGETLLADRTGLAELEVAAGATERMRGRTCRTSRSSSSAGSAST
jgi:hypothetical protein